MDKATLREAQGLLALALRHYRIEVRGRVIRYKQLVLLAVLLLLPGLPAFKAVFVEPLTCIFRSDVTRSAALGAALGYIGLSTIWVRLQKDVISPPDGGAYLATLPLSQAALLCRDAGVLLLASAPLIALLLVAMAFVPESERNAQAAATFACMSISALVVQIGASRNYLTAIVAGLLSATLAVVASAPGPTLILALVITGIVLRDVPANYDAGNSGEFRERRLRSHAAHHPLTAGPGWLMLQWRALWLAQTGTFRSAVTLNGVMGIATAATLLTGSADVTRAAGLIIAFAGLSSLFLALSFATLRAQHVRYGQYLGTLPLDGAKSRVGSILVVQGACSAAVCCLVMVAIARMGFDARLLLPVPVAVMLAVLHDQFHQLAPRHAVLCGVLAMLASLAASTAIR